MKARMKERGLSDEQIEERIEQIKSGEFQPPGFGGPGGPDGSGSGSPDAGGRGQRP